MITTSSQWLTVETDVCMLDLKVHDVRGFGVDAVIGFLVDFHCHRRCLLECCCCCCLSFCFTRKLFHKVNGTLAKGMKSLCSSKSYDNNHIMPTMYYAPRSEKNLCRFPLKYLAHILNLSYYTEKN